MEYANQPAFLLKHLVFLVVVCFVNFFSFVWADGRDDGRTDGRAKEG